MDVTIRNIDAHAYERLRIWAEHWNLGIGAAVSRLVMEHAQLPDDPERKGSIWSLEPWDWGPGSENTSEGVDEILYDEKPERTTN